MASTDNRWMKIHNVLSFGSRWQPNRFLAHSGNPILGNFLSQGHRLRPQEFRRTYGIPVVAAKRALISHAERTAEFQGSAGIPAFFSAGHDLRKPPLERRNTSYYSFRSLCLLFLSIPMTSAVPEMNVAVTPEVKPLLADSDEILLVELIHQADVLGKRAQNGFKPEAWKSVVAKLAEHGIVRNVTSCKERLRYVGHFM